MKHLLTWRIWLHVVGWIAKSVMPAGRPSTMTMLLGRKLPNNGRRRTALRLNLNMSTVWDVVRMMWNIYSAAISVRSGNVLVRIVMSPVQTVQRLTLALSSDRYSRTLQRPVAIWNRNNWPFNCSRCSMWSHEMIESRNSVFDLLDGFSVGYGNEKGQPQTRPSPCAESWKIIEPLPRISRGCWSLWSGWIIWINGVHWRITLPE